MSTILVGFTEASMVQTAEFTVSRELSYDLNNLSKYLTTEDQVKFLNENHTSFQKSDVVFVRNTVYYRKEDLSYANFEDIVDFDHLNLNVRFQKIKQIEHDDFVKIYKGRLDSSSLDKLKMFARLSDPINSSERGGKRFIFQSQTLSKSITTDPVLREKFDDYNDGSDYSEMFEIPEHHIKAKESKQNGFYVLNTSGVPKLHDEVIYENAINYGSEHVMIKKPLKVVESDEDDEPRSLSKQRASPKVFEPDVKPRSKKHIDEDEEDEPMHKKPVEEEDVKPQRKFKVVKKSSIEAFKKQADITPPPTRKLVKKPVSSEERVQKYLSELEVTDTLPSGEDLNGESMRFVGCNSVFRYNRFLPSDKPFKYHYDTPYVDPTNSLMSRYTILIYLSSGSNMDHGALRIIPDPTGNDFVVTTINEGDVFIFDQKYPHIGNPFTEGEKLFIRSELIYEMNNISECQMVADKFNSSCYYQILASKHNDVDLQKYSADLFNDVMRMRLGKQPKMKQRITLKKHNALRYATNGSHYYFTYQETEDLHDYVSKLVPIVIHDYYNIRGIKTESKTVEYDGNEFDLLKLVSFDSDVGDPELSTKYDFFTDVYDTCCCGICGGGTERNITEFVRPYLETNIPSGYPAFYSSELEKLLLSFELDITEESIVTNCKKGKVVFNKGYTKINFASCQCEFHGEFRTSSITGTVYGLPDFEFVIIEEGIIFSIDMFRNGFVYKGTHMIPTIVEA